jgi:hypothetical protein
MSYCRFGWGGSDVYVYEDVSLGIYCCGCALTPGGFIAGNPGADHVAADVMVAHLKEHRRAGHTVPQHAIDSLISEAIDIHGWRWRYTAWRVAIFFRMRWDNLMTRVCKRYGHKPGPAFPGSCLPSEHKLCRRCGDMGIVTSDGDGSITWL